MLLQAGLGDQRAHAVGADRRHGDVGRGIVAVGDHGLEHAHRLGRAGEVEEDRAVQRPEFVVDRQLLVQGEAAVLDVAQVARQDEGLERAAHEPARRGLVPGLPHRRQVGEHQAAGARQAGEAVDRPPDGRPAVVRLGARGERGAGERRTGQRRQRATPQAPTPRSAIPRSATIETRHGKSSRACARRHDSPGRRTMVV